MNLIDLRVGNVVLYSDTDTPEFIEKYIRWVDIMLIEKKIDGHYYKCIPLTEEILLKMGFKLVETAIITRTMQIDLGRDRWLSVSCTGTPNEAVYLSEEEAPVVKDIICLRNYDYDGKTYVHDIQNLFQDITKKPLIFQL